MVECPQCKKRNSQKEKICKGKLKDGNPCGFALAKYSGRVYWVTVRDIYNKQVWERIGPNKAAAEYRERELLTQRAEGRIIKKSPDASTSFKKLADWYLELPEVKAKKGRSYDRDKLSVSKMIPVFGDKLLKDITPAMIEKYKHTRVNEPSYKGTLTKPATVNRELACLKTIFNKGIKNGKAENNPSQGVKLLKENNVRDRLLSEGEYIRLLTTCCEHLKPIVKTAYYTAMRQGEIMGLTWGQIDLREGFIRLKPEDCKTNEARLIPLNGALIEMFKSMPRGLPLVKVFTFKGKSVASIKKGFVGACKRAGIEDFTFHDLRHTAINNWRLQGHDYFRIMAATGHKTMEVFKRYNTVSKEELKALVNENR
jgi:integrase